MKGPLQRKRHRGSQIGPLCGLLLALSSLDASSSFQRQPAFSVRRCYGSLPVLYAKEPRVAKTSKKSKRKLNPKQVAQRQLNSQITKCESAKELLSVLQSTPGCLTESAGGGRLNSVNFSTGLHRLARHSVQDQSRSSTLTDARFALFVASLAEALLDASSIDFQSRELSNIGWALAKLKVAPPSSAMPIEASRDVLEQQLAGKATAVRQAVYAVAKGESAVNAWVPALSQLSGVILDAIASKVVKESLQSRMQMQEYANLLWAWATASRAQASVFEQVLSTMMERQTEEMLELRPQEWSNSVWAAATSSIYAPALIVFLADLFTEYPDFIHQFKSQELSNTAWGIATMLSNAETIGREEEAAALAIVRVVGAEVCRRASDFRTQELSNTLWAMATLGFGLRATSDTGMNNYLVLESDQLEADAALCARAVQAIVEASLPMLPRFRSQELNNLAWALARLVETHREEAAMKELLAGIGRQLCNPRREVSPQDIGTTLWSFATLEFFDSKLYRGIVSRLDPQQVRRAKPQELSNTLWAVATSEMELEDSQRDVFDTSLIPSSLRPEARDPIALIFGYTGQELMRRPFEFKPQELKDVLWSFSKMSIRHPALFKITAEHLVGGDNPRGMVGFSPQGMGNMAWSYARQAQLAKEVSDRIKGNHLSSNNGRLAVYTASYFDVGETLLQRLFQSIADAAIELHSGLQKLKPQDVSNTAWTYAVLGLSHRRFMDTAMSELQRRVGLYLSGDASAMNLFKGQELGNLLWALATLNIPIGNLLERLEPYFQEVCKDRQGKITSTSIARIFKRQELANIAWSCAVFGEYPSVLMRLLYTGLLGVDDNPKAMAKLHADSGVQPQAIMSLIYVQAAMDLEGLGGDLHLPPGFPDEWRQWAPSKRDDHETDTTIELNLSTSKIQRAVSSAFDRVGFDHVDEHVITMAELADQGIQLAPQPLEILSIDIANLQQKIAIEVDGPAHFITSIDEVIDKGGHALVINGKLEYQFRWNGDRQAINGPTALKQRLLSRLGWTVIHLPFWEWYALDGNEAAEEDYCRRLLAQARQDS